MRAEKTKIRRNLDLISNLMGLTNQSTNALFFIKHEASTWIIIRGGNKDDFVLITNVSNEVGRESISVLVGMSLDTEKGYVIDLGFSDHIC